MLESTTRSDEGNACRFPGDKRQACSLLILHMRCWEARKPLPVCYSTAADLVSRTRMQIKQPRFDSVNADFSVANVSVELLRTKNVHEASVLHFGSGGALGAARGRIWMSQQLFEETARPHLRSRRIMPIKV